MDSNAMNLFSSLLSNPEALNNIKGMLGNMGDDGKRETEGDDVKTNNNPSQQIDMSFITDFLNQNKNSELLHRVSNAYNVYSSNSSPGIGLLEALSPYLSSKRAANLERVKNVIRMTNAFSEFSRK